MIGVVDYGAGNLRSVANALDRIGVRFEVCHEASRIDGCERIVLPGVGHFGAAARSLARTGMLEALRRTAREQRPLLGICLGLQLLLDSSEEAPGAEGLGVLPGRSIRLDARTVPHMGWNQVSWSRPTEAAPRAAEDGHYYFAHGYVAAPSDGADVIAATDIDDRSFPAAIGRGAVLGVQFHPEKSGDRGLALLDDFCRC